MLKYITVFSIFLLSILAQAVTLQQRFENGAMIDYQLRSAVDPKDNAMLETPDTLRFFSKNNTLLWELPLFVKGATLNYFYKDEKESTPSGLETGKNKTITWQEFDRNALVTIDGASELIPVIDGSNKMLISSAGEIIPVVVETSNYIFMKAKWQQYRWELPDGNTYRALVDYSDAVIDDNGNTKVNGTFNRLILIRENDWAYSESSMSESVMESLYNRGLKPYVNRESSKLSFNIVQVHGEEESVTFDLNSMKRIKISPDLKALFESKAKLFESARSVVSRESDAISLMSDEGIPLENTPSLRQKKLEESVEFVLSVAYGRFSKYPQLAEKILNNGRLNTFSPELEKQLALAIIKDLMGPMGEQIGYPLLLPEGDQIRIFLQNFFVSLKSMEAKGQTEFNLSQFQNNPIARREFNDSYENLILRGFKSLPRYPSRFSGRRDYDIAIHLTKMCQNLDTIGPELKEIFNDYNLSKAGNSPQYQTLAQEMRLLFATKDHKIDVAINIINRKDATFDQIKEIAFTYESVPVVLRKAGERVIQLSLSHPSLNDAEVRAFLMEVHSLIPEHSEDYGRFSTKYLDFLHQTADKIFLDCEQKLKNLTRIHDAMGV